MVSSQPVQPTWVQEKDNQFWVNSLILLPKVKMKKDSKSLPGNLVFKQEEWEDNILQWMKKALQIFHQVPDLELKNLTLLKNYTQV